jgi:hypothetical protein
VAAEGIDVWNPVFDVTPASLIDGIVTECVRVSIPGVGCGMPQSGLLVRAVLTGTHITGAVHVMPSMIRHGVITKEAGQSSMDVHAFVAKHAAAANRRNSTPAKL